MGWRKIVHRVTGKCMGRNWTFSKAEVRVELCTDCDGESWFSAGLFKFGELVDHAHSFEGDDVTAKVLEWLENDQP